MAGKTLKDIHPFLALNLTETSSGCTVQSFSHDHGHGPVLIMVHGWPQSSYMWRHLVPEVKDKISLFIPDLPGYGFSSFPPKHDKRTVGNILLEVAHKIFGPDRPIVWCGHDRGARVGHRLIVDNDPSYNIKCAIFMDIVPTTEQWRVFANPRAAVAYCHWPLLAAPAASQLVQAVGGAVFTKHFLDRAKGGNPAGTAKFEAHDAVAHYCQQFEDPTCIAGACGDYAAGAFEDVDEQTKDQEQGRKVTLPLMVIYSESNLGRMHDVPTVWKEWVDTKCELRNEGLPDGIGHYLPEEAPGHVAKLVHEWINKYAA